MQTVDVNVQLNKILKEYTDELEVEAQQAFREVGKETKKELTDKSKQLFHHKSQKHYADGWRYTVRGKGLGLVLTVYNATKPGLTHLLENGHMILIRGKNFGRSKSFKHIEPAEKNAIDKLLKRLMK